MEIILNDLDLEKYLFQNSPDNSATLTVRPNFLLHMILFKKNSSHNVSCRISMLLGS